MEMDTAAGVSGVQRTSSAGYVRQHTDTLAIACKYTQLPQAGHAIHSVRVGSHNCQTDQHRFRLFP